VGDIFFWGEYGRMVRALIGWSLMFIGSMYWTMVRFRVCMMKYLLFFQEKRLLQVSGGGVLGCLVLEWIAVEN
jgi:hypothetical protein